MAGRRYSFVLPLEVERQLLEIKEAAGLANPSAAMRQAIRVCYEQLRAPGPSQAGAKEQETLQKVVILQKHILVEIAKLHNGQARLSDKGQAYLEKLNRKVKDNLKEVGHEQ